MIIGIEELKQLDDPHQRQKLIDRQLCEVCDLEEHAVRAEQSAEHERLLAVSYREQAKEAQAMLDVLQNFGKL